MALKVDPATGAVYDDGTPEPPGIPAELAQPLPWTPPPDAQAAIDAVMGVPQVQPADVPAAVDAVSGGAQPPTQLDSLRAAMTAGQATPEQNTRRAELEAAARSPGGIPVADAIELARMRDQEDADNAALRGGGRPGDMTPERLAALAEPGYTPPADPQVGPNGTLLGGGGSVSTAESGYSSEAEAKIGKGAPLQGALSANDALKAQAEADYNAALAESDAILAAQRKAAAEQAQVESDELEAALDTEKKYQEDQQKAWSKLEAGLIAAEAEAEATKQRYLQDRAAASAMVVDPSAAWRGKSGAAMGIAMMAQGWLANMGPGSPVLMDVQGMIDKIVQDNISAQTANRANAWKTVEASDNLWALARDGAEDEVEAYTRYKGFLTDAYNTQVKVNALKFAGPKAAAAAAAADAAMVADASARAKALRDEKYARMSDIQKQDYDAHMTWLKESQATKRAYAGRSRAPAQPPPPPWSDASDMIIGPDGELLGMLKFPPSVENSTKVEATSAKNTLAGMEPPAKKALTMLEKLRDKYKGKLSEIGDNAEDVASLQAAHALLFSAMRVVNNTGAALSAGEKENIQATIPIGSNFQEFVGLVKSSPDYAKMLADGIQGTRDMLTAKYAAYIVDADEPTRAWYNKYTPTRATENTGSRVVLDATASGDRPKPTQMELDASVYHGTDANGDRDPRDFLPGASFKTMAGAQAVPDDGKPWDGNPYAADAIWREMVDRAKAEKKLGYIAKRATGMGKGADRFNPMVIDTTGKIEPDGIPQFVSMHWELYRSAWEGNEDAKAQLEDIVAQNAVPEPSWSAAFFLDKLNNRKWQTGDAPFSAWDGGEPGPATPKTRRASRPMVVD